MTEICAHLSLCKCIYIPEYPNLWKLGGRTPGTPILDSAPDFILLEWFAFNYSRNKNDNCWWKVYFVLFFKSSQTMLRKPISFMFKIKFTSSYLVITRKLSRNYEKRSRNYEKRSRNYEKRLRNYEKIIS